MKTGAIRKALGILQGAAVQTDMGPRLYKVESALSELAALERALAEAEKREAVKDVALQQAALRFELLAIAGIGVTNGVDPMAGVRDCHAAISSEQTGIDVGIAAKSIRETVESLENGPETKP